LQAVRAQSLRKFIGCPFGSPCALSHSAQHQLASKEDEEPTQQQHDLALNSLLFLMRVIGGEFRSRPLKSVPGLDTRPTPDRLRESLFSILALRLEGATFADLYAGTGAVGIEALSRGARKAIFVESHRTAVNILRDNLRSLGLDTRAEVRASKANANLTADIIFLDPPYHQPKEYATLLNTLRAPLVIAQHPTRLTLDDTYSALKKVRTLRQGDNCLSFYELAGSA
jgi:16S rRNA (guanine966-N2)-methyltransferase